MADRCIACDYRYLNRYFLRRSRGLNPVRLLPGWVAAVLLVLWLFAMSGSDPVRSFYQEDHEIVWSMPGSESGEETWHIKLNLRRGEMIITHDFVTERR